MSSLQKQLAAIAATSAHELDLKAQKIAYSKSLLFEPQVAKSQSLETIFQICHEGFVELCDLDARFIVFGRTLFSPQSLREDREQLTRKESEDLDNVIDGFLHLVGARLLLKPALKSVEWLIRRFRIHEHNSQSTILTFLPYHTFPIFQTLLSLLPKTLSPTFKFLHPYMHTLTNPPRSALVYSAIHNRSFFSALNEYVLLTCRADGQYPTMLSFWAGMMTQAIDGLLDSTSAGNIEIQHQREEDILSRILPVLNQGLQIIKAPELVLGCYMIMTVLVSKGNLTDDTIDAFMQAIISRLSEELYNSALSCLALMTGAKTSPLLTDAAGLALLRHENLANDIRLVASQQSAESLIYGISHAAIKYLDVSENHATFLKYSFSSGSLSTAQTSELFARLVEFVESHAEVLGSEAALRSRCIGVLSVCKDQPAVREVIEVGSFTEVNVLGLVKDILGLPQFALDTLPREAKSRDSQAQLIEFTPDPGISLSDLPDSMESSSFLDLSVDSPFGDLLRAYKTCLLSPKLLSDFQNIPILRQETAVQSTEFFSFFLRVLLVVENADAQTQALQILVNKLKTCQDSDFDPQAFLVPTILSLTNPSIKVRQSAAELVARLFKLIKKSVSRTAPEHSIWGAQTLFGSASSTVSWLAARDCKTFINGVLLPALEECISDDSHIAVAIQQALEGNSSQKSNEHAGSKIKSGQKFTIFSFLSSQTSLLPLQPARNNLLAILNRIKKVCGQPRSKFLLPTLRDWIQVSDEVMVDGQEMRPQEIARADKEHFAIVRPADEDALLFLDSVLFGEEAPTRPGVQSAGYRRLEELWLKIKPERISEYLPQLLYFAASTPQDKLGEQRQMGAATLLQNVKLSPEQLVMLLNKATQSIGEEEHVPKVKRMRLDPQAGASHGDDASGLAQLTFVLELVDSSKVHHDVTLFQALFGTLQTIQTYKSRSVSELGYLQVLAINNLASIMRSMHSHAVAKLDTSLVRTDLLVDCVRKSPNPEIRNAALLLLSLFAKYAPQSILHSIMPVFTFMTASAAQQNDSFSAHVVDETIRAVVPVLADTFRKQNKDVISAVAEILQSFASAYPHIPSHRRLRLFHLLTESLGPEESLFAVLATLIDSSPNDANLDRFGCALLNHFDLFESLISLNKYLDLTIDGLSQQPGLCQILLVHNFSSSRDECLFGLLHPLPKFFKDPIIRGKLQSIFKGSEESMIRLRELSSGLVERLMRISHATKPQRRLHGLTQTCLQSLLDMLPAELFVQSASNLLDHEDYGVKRSVLTIIRDRLEANRLPERASQLGVIRLLPRLTSLLEPSVNIALKTSIIACIDRISEKVGKLEPDSVFAAAQIVSSPQVLGTKDSVVIQTLSLHCLTSMVEILQNDFIPLVQETLRLACEALEAVQAIISDQAEQLHNAAQVFYAAVVTHLPFVITATSLGGILRLSQASAASTQGETAVEMRSITLQQIAHKMDVQTLLGALSDCLPLAITGGTEALEESISLLNMFITRRSKSVITNSAEQIFNLLLLIMDVRRRSADDLARTYTSDAIEQIEAAAIETLLSLVLKLNDSIFRPLYTRLVSWASQDLGDIASLESVLRATSMLKFVLLLSERLQSIVTSYASEILDCAVTIMQQKSLTSSKQLDLLSTTLMTMSSLFKYDQDDFWQSPIRFDMIVEPLVSQFEHRYSKQLESAVISCIVELASSASSNDHHRKMNNLLLKSMKSHDARTRLGAVLCQKRLTETVGEDWLQLLPEMLPVISELQEDDDEEVEKQTIAWIKSVEGVLGESLDSMLQ